MSILSWTLIGGTSNSEPLDALATIVLAPYMLSVFGVNMAVEAIGNASTNMANKIKEKAKIKANKKEYEELATNYPKISADKLGSVEVVVSEDGKTKSTIVHTKYGPFIKTETNDYSQKITNGQDLAQTSVRFSGFVVALDENGKKLLTYLDNVGHAFGQCARINAMNDDGFPYYSRGSLLSPTGDRKFLDNYQTIETLDNCAHLPKNTNCEFIQNLEQKFEEILQKAQEINHTSNTNL